MVVELESEEEVQLSVKTSSICHVNFGCAIPHRQEKFTPIMHGLIKQIVFRKF
jgi:hypothetical protein